MDAKKAAKFRKPLQFTKTNAFKAINIVFAGLVGYTFLSILFYAKFVNKNPSRYMNNVIDKYMESDEYLLNRDRARGRAPPTREEITTFWKKHMTDKHYEGTRPAI